jgi:uncharacterized protein YdhG (YjbR/CyaY superfamily)
MAKPANFDDYISQFPYDVQAGLQTVRETIQQAAPGAGEVISYSMPLFKFHGRLVYFAAFEKHIGFYPMASGISAFKQEIAAQYKWAKGSVQFPHGQPLPVDLITRIIKFRVTENLEKAQRNNLKKLKPAK